MKTNKLIAIFLAALLIAMLIPCASACNEKILDTEIVDLGDGIWMEIITIEEIPSIAVFSLNREKNAYKTATITSGSMALGRFTLYGTFEYDGTYAEAIDDNYTYEVEPGYRASASSSHSGATVKGSCTISGNGISKTVNLKMTCDKNGNIS